jgi:hypothetical protein
LNINEAWKELRLACSEEENCAGCIQVKTCQHKEAASVIHRILEAAGALTDADERALEIISRATAHWFDHESTEDYTMEREALTYLRSRLAPPAPPAANAVTRDWVARFTGAVYEGAEAQGNVEENVIEAAIPFLREIGVEVEK